jgi:hypothetical protein
MNLFNRVKSILLTPKTEWDVIAGESQSMQSVIMSYIVPLSLLGAVATFIGYAFVWILADINWGLLFAIIVLVSNIVSVLVATFVVDALAPSFGSEKNINRSAQLVGYCYTPALIGAMLSIVPALSIVGSLLGLYGIYLWYLGLGPMKKTPEDKKVGYLIVSILVLIVVWYIIKLILTKILLSMLGLSLLSL